MEHRELARYTRQNTGTAEDRERKEPLRATEHVRMIVLRARMYGSALSIPLKTSGGEGKPGQRLIRARSMGTRTFPLPDPLVVNGGLSDRSQLPPKVHGKCDYGDLTPCTQQADLRGSLQGARRDANFAAVEGKQDARTDRDYVAARRHASNLRAGFLTLGGCFRRLATNAREHGRLRASIQRHASLRCNK